MIPEHALLPVVFILSLKQQAENDLFCATSDEDEDEGLAEQVDTDGLTLIESWVLDTGRSDI